MAKIGKKGIPISDSDLKQAIVKRNNSLKRQNDSLSISVKGKEKEIKSLEKEHSSKSKNLGVLIKDIEFQEERIKKLKGGLYSNEKLLADKLKKVGIAESELCDYEIGVEKLEERERKLLDKIASLEFYKSKCVDSKSELAGLQAKKDCELDNIKNIKDDISKLYVDHNNKVLSYEREYDALEEKAKKHEDMVFQFEQRLIETEDQFKDEENKLRNLLAKSKIEKEKASNELQAITNLCNNTEDEYVKWEVKIKKAKENVSKEEEHTKKAKENFAKWKIGVLEEVARIKLKNKVDKIDKAGLSEILNG